MAANPSIQLGTDGNWAIKEDNLLAYKKDGTRFFNKEFDFTRGSFATFVDKDGLIKVSGVTDTELVVNGDFATDSDWFKTTGWSISNGQAIASTGAYNTLQQVFPIVLGKTYEVKFDVTSITSGSISMTLGANSGLQRNQIGSYTEIIEYNNFFASSGPRSGSGGFVGSIDNVSVKEIQTDVPRIDFTDDATGHLLLEPQSTNLITFSEDFSHSSWGSTGVTIVSDSAKSPSGNPNATLLKGNTNSSRHNVFRAGLSASSTAALSLFAKAKELRYLQIASAHTADQYVNFDLQDGLIGTVGSSFSNAKIENYGNGWYKLSVVSDSQYNSFYISLISGTNATWLENWSMPNNTDGLFIYGAQLEEKSYATSYIPTFGSAVTRNAEVCNNSGSAQDFNDSEGVLYCEIAALADDETNRKIAIGSSTNRIIFGYRYGSNKVRVEIISSDSVVFDNTQIIDNITTFNKFAVKYKQNDFSLWINSQKVSVDTSGNTPIGLNELAFDDGSTNPFYGKIREVQVFKRAMSDGELYLLTVTQYQSYQEMATALNYTL